MSKGQNFSLPLEVVGLGHGYGDTPVLDQVNFCVHPGELVAVLGTSGCGKTTLLRCIAGLVTPNVGTLTINGVVSAQDGRELCRTEQRNIGLVFQEYALFPNLTVRENVSFGVDGAERRARVDALLAQVGVENLADRRPAALSGGQQQRVALARALAPSPSLLLLDEPFANIDAGRRMAIGDSLRRLLRAHQTSALLVTHDRMEALSLADRVVVLSGGPSGAKIAQDASPEKIYSQPVDQAVAMLTGGGWFLSASGEGQQATTVLGSAELLEPRHGDITILVRPHQASFVPTEDGPQVVVDARFVGHTWRISCESQDGPVRIVESASSVARGQRGLIQFSQPLWALP